MTSTPNYQHPTLEIRNLSFLTTDKELLDEISKYAVPFKVDIYKNNDGLSKGMARVQFKELKDAQMVSDAMNRREFQSRTLWIFLHAPPAPPPPKKTTTVEKSRTSEHSKETSRSNGEKEYERANRSDRDLRNSERSSNKNSRDFRESPRNRERETHKERDRDVRERERERDRERQRERHHESSPRYESSKRSRESSPRFENSKRDRESSPRYESFRRDREPSPQYMYRNADYRSRGLDDDKRRRSRGDDDYDRDHQKRRRY